jgi:hypothetical protein
MEKYLIKNLVLLSSIACVLSACSPKDEPCDMTGKRYGKMMEEGTPLTEKDKACLNAVMIKGFQDAAKTPIPPIEYEKPHSQDWGKALNLKK